MDINDLSIIPIREELEALIFKNPIVYHVYRHYVINNLSYEEMLLAMTIYLIQENEKLTKMLVSKIQNGQ